MRSKVKTAGMASALIIIGIGGFFLYLDKAFPEVRCEAAHLAAPEGYEDCLSCHVKVTAQVAQDWKESKHGVMLVKCVVCHGEPDGKGSIPFAARPDQQMICSRCHDPAMQRMTAKFGGGSDCGTCHPRHQNPMHADAYQKTAASGKTSF
ncbi:MAG: hypothetical protein LBC14_06685 [Desulfovibrio sp.]|jgi:hypothetical protein|nr:hypothetical protein [Desulfovibrio sp.]